MQRPVRRRLAFGGAAALVAAAFLLFAGVWRGGDRVATGSAAASATPDVLTGPVAAGDTAALTAQLQATLRANPQDVHAYDLLGLAYQQRARETGDPAYYAKSAGALHRALALAPHDAIATSALGSLALSRHRFRDALGLGREARRLAPATARNYGVIGDALVELGRYREAFRAFDTMTRLKPSVASYARIAYARELLGNTPGAIRAMRLAQDAATAEPEALAWTHVQLGKLFFAHGRYDAAAREDRAGLAAFPGYVYGYDALAQVAAAHGLYRRAIAFERRAVDAIPLPQFVSTLGDLYRVTGRPAKARREYATIGVIERLLRANGVSTDLETALFDVDHGIRLARTLELARVAQRERPSIDGDDVLAWALVRTGHCAEAATYSRHALRLGTLDATKFFHRGMIERCLGHSTAARTWFRRSLALNPHFSLVWAPVARRLSR